MVNQKKWNALPEDLKKILADAAKFYWDKLVDAYDEELKKADDIVKAGKLTVCTLDEQCQAAHKAAAMKVWDSVASKDPGAAKAIEIIKTWQK